MQDWSTIWPAARREGRLCRQNVATVSRRCSHPLTTQLKLLHPSLELFFCEGSRGYIHYVVQLAQAPKEQYGGASELYAECVICGGEMHKQELTSNIVKFLVSRLHFFTAKGSGPSNWQSASAPFGSSLRATSLLAQLALSGWRGVLCLHLPCIERLPSVAAHHALSAFPVTRVV